MGLVDVCHRWVLVWVPEWGRWSVEWVLLMVLCWVIVRVLGKETGLALCWVLQMVLC